MLDDISNSRFLCAIPGRYLTFPKNLDLALLKSGSEHYCKLDPNIAQIWIRALLKSRSEHYYNLDPNIIQI